MEKTLGNGGVRVRHKSMNQLKRDEKGDNMGDLLDTSQAFS